jgi:rhodanese-related sulfurtransferase
MMNAEIKALLYEQVARIGRAVGSPKRLELLELLAQGEKTVEALAAELDIDMRLASAHLKTLRETKLAVARRDGKHMVYRLSGDGVPGLVVKLREVAEEHLLELRAALEGISTSPKQLTTVGRAELLEQARRGEIIVIDVRPAGEYEAAHLPYARSMPLSELEKRINELPLDREIVAYCRGPYCLLSDAAVQLLAGRGLRVRKIQDGVSEWQAAGLPVEKAIAA